jgi:hypothetical protein
VKKEQLEEKPKTPAAPPPEPAVPGESHPEMTFGETGAATVVVEAENFFAGFEQGESKWLAVSQAGASGDKAVEAGPNKGTVFEDKFESLAPRLDFRVLLARKGRYYVWVRGLGKSGADDSCHVGVNGKTNANCKHVNRFSTAWNWTLTTIDSRTPYFDVKSPGWHTFNLWMREDGLIVDKIVLTTDDKLVPSGLGPAESPKSEEKKK